MTEGELVKFDGLVRECLPLRKVQPQAWDFEKPFYR